MQTRRRQAIRILLLAANPLNTTTLRLDHEARDIQEVLERAEVPSEVRHFTAVRARDIPRKLRTFRPNFVHFSGHGEKDKGIVLEDVSGRASFVPHDALASLFKLFKPVKCVILNSCYSHAQSISIVEHVPYVIGMSEAIGDKAATEFAFGFYQAIGDGASIPSAFEYGKTAIRLANLSNHSQVPILLRKEKRKPLRLSRLSTANPTGPTHIDQLEVQGDQEALSSPEPQHVASEELAVRSHPVIYKDGITPSGMPNAVPEPESPTNDQEGELSETNFSYDLVQSASWAAFERFCIAVLQRYYEPYGFAIHRTSKQSGADLGGDGTRDGQATLVLGAPLSQHGAPLDEPDLGIVITLWVEVKKRSKRNVSHSDVGGTLLRSSLESVTKLLFVSNRDFTTGFREELKQYAQARSIQFGLLDGRSLICLAENLFHVGQSEDLRLSTKGESCISADLSFSSIPTASRMNRAGVSISLTLGDPLFIVVYVEIRASICGSRELQLQLEYAGDEPLLIMPYSGCTRQYVEPGDQFASIFVLVSDSPCLLSPENFTLRAISHEDQAWNVACTYDPTPCNICGTILPVWIPPSKEEKHAEVRLAIERWLTRGGHLALDITAIAGTGKSHLLRAVRKTWLSGGAIELLLDGANEQTARDVALAVFQQIFPTQSNEFDEDLGRSLLEWLTKSGLPMESAAQLVATFGEAPADREVPVTTAQLSHFAAVALVHFSTSSPIVLSFEDLHKCLPSAISMLQGIRQRLDRSRRGRICTIFTSREDSIWDDETLRDEWRQAVNRMRAGNSLAIQLTSFDHGDAIALISRAVPTIEEYYAEIIVEQVGTSPLSIREALALLNERGAIEPGPVNGEWMLTSPDEILHTIESQTLRDATRYRIISIKERYPEWLADLLDSGACLGRFFRLEACLDEIDLIGWRSLDSALAECRRLEIVKPATHSPTLLQFDHDLIRLVILQEIGTSRQRRLANALYVRLESHEEDMTLASLAYQAGRADECWSRSLKVAVTARASHRHGEAVRAIGLALAVTDINEAAPAFTFARSRSRPLFDDAISVAEPCFRESLSTVERDKETALLLLEYAEHVIAISSAGSGIIGRIITECALLAERTDDVLIRATTEMLQGRHEASRNNIANSLAFHQHAEALFLRLGLSETAARRRTENLVRLAIAHRQAGDAAESRLILLRAIRSRFRVNWALAGNVRSNMGATFFSTDWAAVRHHWNRAVRITKNHGVVHHYVHSLIDIAYLDLLEDKREIASVELEEALRISRDYGYENSELRCLLNLGCLALTEGRLLHAIKLLREGDFLAMRHQIKRRLWRIRANMATAYFMLGRIDRSYVADRITIRALSGIEITPGTLDETQHPALGSRFILALGNLAIRAEESELHRRLLWALPDALCKSSTEVARVVREGRHSSLPGLHGRHCKDICGKSFFIITE
jgi:tetratricopeptide (TPR) repeat protein